MWRKLRSKDRGFTLIELLVVIGIVVVLAAMLFPALNRSVGSAKATQCTNNLKQVGIAFNLYAADHDFKVVPMENGNGWQYYLNEYCGGTTNSIKKTFDCVSDRPAQTRSYRINTSGTRLNSSMKVYSDGRKVTAIKSPASFILIMDIAYLGSYVFDPFSDDTCIWGDAYDSVPQYAVNYTCLHDNGKSMPILFADGHVARVPRPIPSSDSRWYWDE